MTKIYTNLQWVRTRIEKAALTASRSPDSISLLAVSKTWPADAVRHAHAAGQIAFGENYLQEALDKVRALSDLPLEWHFIGALQSNKTAAVAAHFQWVHSVDRFKIAERLSHQRDVHLPPLNVCLQVNTSGEASKSGISLEALPELAKAVSELPRLRLRGLMTIPEPSKDPALQRARFAGLRGALTNLNAAGLHLDTLSMGMSEDLEMAIAEGATLVRVGTAIFGERQSSEISV